jgi:transposase
MNSVTCFVGLDYHQDSVQVCVLDGQGEQRLNRACRNDWRAIQDAVAEVGPVQAAGVEACGGSADLAQELRDHAAWPIDLAHAGYVAKLKQSPDKTDFSDGRLLADLTRVGYLPKVWLAPAYERDLRALVHYRQGLVDQRRTVKLRVGALLREQRAFPPEGPGPKKQRLRAWTGLWLIWARTAAPLSAPGRWILDRLLDQIAPLDRQIRQVEQQLHKLTAHDPRVVRLRQEPGIGPVTAWVLRAYVGPFERFRNGKHLSRYCGLSPCNRSSGAKRADAGLIQGCNKLLRATLIQAAHRLIRTVPRWRSLALALSRRGKKRCVIVAAVGNRWMRGLWYRHLPTPA